MRTGHCMLSWMGGQILVEVFLKQWEMGILSLIFEFQTNEAINFNLKKPSLFIVRDIFMKWEVAVGLKNRPCIMDHLQRRIGKSFALPIPGLKKIGSLISCLVGAIWSLWFHSFFIPSPAKPAEQNAWSSDQAYIALPHIHWTPGMMEGIEGAHYIHDYIIIMPDLCCVAKAHLLVLVTIAFTGQLQVFWNPLLTPSFGFNRLQNVPKDATFRVGHPSQCYASSIDLNLRWWQKSLLMVSVSTSHFFL